MTFLLDCTIQISAVFLIALSSLRLLRRKSAALRHWILSVAIFFAAITPVLHLVMPSWDPGLLITERSIGAPLQEQISAITPPETGTQIEGAMSPAKPGIVKWRPEESLIARWWPGVIWLIGAAVELIVMLTGLARLARLASASRPMANGQWTRLAVMISSEYKIRPFVQLLYSQNPSILVTWGVIRPKVILPAGAGEWPEDRVRIVLRHELAHVRRRDWVVQMAAQTLRIIYWFNPLVWIVSNRLRLESECACDDAVLSQDMEGPEYAAHLLELAQALNRPDRAWSAALTMARPSTIERRFSAMLNPALNRRPATLFAMLATVLVGLCITLPLARLSTAAPASSPVTNPAPATPERAEAAPRLESEATPTKPAPRTTTSAAQVARENVSHTTNIQAQRAGSLHRALYEAAETGDLSEIEALIRAGANVNGAVAGDGSALIGAARKGRLEAVRALLDRGADPNMPVLGDGNPLIMAAAKGHADVVTLLLDRGANIDQMVPGDENALIQASAGGHLPVVMLLVSHRADVNARAWVEPTPWRPNGEWRTPLSMARKGGHREVVAFLLFAGARD